MDNRIKAIRVDCATNCDLNGYWLREDLEKECESIEISKEDWMSYLFSHLFSDYSEWNSAIEGTFINNDSIVSMRVMLGYYRVDITKIYK